MGRNFAPRIDENERHLGFDVTPNGVMSLEGRPHAELQSKSKIETPDNGHLLIQAMLDSADKTLKAPTPTSKPPGYQG